MTNEKDISLKLFVVLSRALEAINRRVKADVKNYGLNITEFAVLELLYHRGDQPIQKIGDKVLIASSSITYVVDQLEKKQYVTRRPCPNDRRITYASLTVEGRKLMDEIFPKHRDAISHIFSVLSIEEQKQLTDQLKRLGLFAQQLN